MSKKRLATKEQDSNMGQATLKELNERIRKLYPAEYREAQRRYWRLRGLGK